MAGGNPLCGPPVKINVAFTAEGSPITAGGLLSGPFQKKLAGFIVLPLYKCSKKRCQPSRFFTLTPAPRFHSMQACNYFIFLPKLPNESRVIIYVAYRWLINTQNCRWPTGQPVGQEPWFYWPTGRPVGLDFIIGGWVGYNRYRYISMSAAKPTECLLESSSSTP